MNRSLIGSISHAVGVRHARLLRGHDGQDHVLLVQHLVVLQAVHQRGRRAVGIAGQEHGRARHQRRRLLGQLVDQEVERDFVLARLLEQQPEPRTQVHMMSTMTAATAIDTQPPSTILTSVRRGRSRVSMTANSAVSATAAAQRPLPAAAHDDEQQDASSPASRRSRRCRRPTASELDSPKPTTSSITPMQQQHVDARHVDLARLRSPRCAGSRSAAAGSAARPGGSANRRR